MSCGGRDVIQLRAATAAQAWAQLSGRSGGFALLLT